MFTGFFILAFAVVVVLAGLLLAWAGFRGRPTLSEPTCRACGHDLRGVALDGGGACSECGADLSKRHAVSFGRLERRPVLVGAGCLIAILPFGLLTSLLFVSVGRMGGAVAPIAATQPTSQLITSIGTTLEDPNVAPVLHERYAANFLSPLERDALVDAVVGALEASAPRADEPLHWSGELVGAILADPSIDDARKQRIVDAYYGDPPEVDSRPQVRSGSDAWFEIAGGRTWQLPGFGQMTTVRAARLDDEPIDPATLVARADALSAIAPFDLSGRLPTDLPLGTHTLELDLVVGLFPNRQRDGIRLGIEGSADARARELTHRWEQTVTIEFELLPADQSPIDLITTGVDPDLIRAALQPRTLIADTRNGRPRLRIELDAAPDVALPVAFDVVARCEAGEFLLGGFARSTDGSTRSGRLATTLDVSLPPSITEATVILRPSVERAERVPSIVAIWGEDVVFEGVPIRRDDLAPDDG